MTKSIVSESSDNNNNNNKDKSELSNENIIKNNNNNNNVYTWEEVSEHNQENDAWIICDNKVYNITDWIPKHPGGSQMLLLFAGRDVSDIIRSYHPFTDKPYNILFKYEIGVAKSTEFPKYKADSGFYKELRNEVKQYFNSTGYNPRSIWPGFIRLVFMLIAAFYTLSIAYDTQQSWFIRIIFSLLYGVCQAMPLLHIMHDSSHCAIGNNEWAWKFLGRLTLDWFAGASMTQWHNQHVAGHHLYTNVMGADPDLPVAPKGDLRRVTYLQLHQWMYRFQHVYLMFLYGLLSMKIRIQDVAALFSKQNGPIRVNQHGISEPMWQFITKSTWISWRFLIPHYYMNVPWFDLAIVFIISDLVQGYFLAFNFQVSHLSPSTIFPDINSSFDDEWAISQVKTTVDYAHGNVINTFLAGALNYQTVHHLFPSISQYHYPAIAPIVRKVCDKYNVPFTLLPDFSTALSYHVQHLYELGQNKNHVH